MLDVSITYLNTQKVENILYNVSPNTLKEFKYNPYWWRVSFHFWTYLVQTSCSITLLNLPLSSQKNIRFRQKKNLFQEKLKNMENFLTGEKSTPKQFFFLNNKIEIVARVSMFVCGKARRNTNVWRHSLHIQNRLAYHVDHSQF